MLKFLRRNRYDVFLCIFFFFFVEQFFRNRVFSFEGQTLSHFALFNLVPWFLHVSSGREVRIKKKKKIYIPEERKLREI